MAGPFALIDRALDRGLRGGTGAKQKRRRDPNNPADADFFRAMHPDFDEVMGQAQMDYKDMCQTDAQFADKFPIPPVAEPIRSFREHTNSVDAVSWGPDPGTCISASHDRTLKVWDVASGRCLKTLAGHAEGVYHCEVACAGKLLVSCGAGSTKNALVWQWPQAKVCLELQGHRVAVYHAASSSDGTLVSTTDKEGTVLVHDTAKGVCTFRQSSHVGVAHGSSFCREDPNLLITCGQDGHIKLLDLREVASVQSSLWQSPSRLANSAHITTSLEIQGAHGGEPVYALVLSDRSTLFSVGADHKLKRWDLRALKWLQPQCACEYLGHTASVRGLAVSEDACFLATACEDGSCRLWRRDALGGAKVKRQQFKANPGMKNGYATAELVLNGHNGLVSGCAWKGEASRKSAEVLSCSWDQTVQLFSVDLSEF